MRETLERLPRYVKLHGNANNSIYSTSNNWLNAQTNESKDKTMHHHKSFLRELFWPTIQKNGTS